MRKFKLITRRASVTALAALMAVGLGACNQGTDQTTTTAGDSAKTTTTTAAGSDSTDQTTTAAGTEETEAVTVEVTTVSDDTDTENTPTFTDRDMEQEADVSEATTLTVADGEDVNITAEGVYVLSGTATECQIIVDCADDAKVQLVLDNLNITNADSPAIYVKTAKKVFVTTTASSTNTLCCTGEFVTDGTTNTDAVIFSKEDLVLNGEGTLQVTSSDNGITCKDDLKVTGGTYVISAQGDGLEANDLIAICGGTFTINADDAIHCSNDDDATLGALYISGGLFDLTAQDDGLHAQTTVTIDGGEVSINAGEGIESTNITFNDGTVSVTASDDGINATDKSSAFSICITVNGGTVNVTTTTAKADAFDSKGDIIVTGGTVNITATSAFDFDGSSSLTGGEVYVNGTQITQIKDA
ncbi:MAG: carbohydrate-binding domain-containing protein [Lachnospiraceae bacterium]|nr:carbohydrate-binding domain-containing protein [Lachnospiraceae bacterium]